MEVFCPNCPQRYRIPIDRVPKKPRMVMCNTCGNTWMQHFPKAPLLSALGSIKTHGNIRPVKRPIYPKAVLTVLQEEAALEAKLRS